MLKVSVIIPVYNANKYVKEAVSSALAQPETAEVILIEDGSLDDSLAVCQGLANKHDKVRLLRHPNGKNRGAGASRNLGMKNARFGYIAFLDADDFYLPHRFLSSVDVFSAIPECEGVYEAVGIHFEDEQARKEWLESPMGVVDVTTVNKVVLPDKLFGLLANEGLGHIHINGLIIKKSVLAKTGYMDENLRLHQDTDFILRLCATANLYPGNLVEPVAKRRVHGQNRISAQRDEKRIFSDSMRQRHAIYHFLRVNKYDDKQHLIVKPIIDYYTKTKPLPFGLRKSNSYGAKCMIALMLLPFDFPRLILEIGYWKKLTQIPLSSLKYQISKTRKNT